MMLQPDESYCQRILLALGKCFRSLLIIPAQFCEIRWNEKSCAGFRRPISMVSGDARRIPIRMEHNQLNIIVYSYSEGGADHFGMHFIIHRTVMRPED